MTAAGGAGAGPGWRTAAGLGALAALLALQIAPWWTPTPDAAAYISMARSLAATGELRRFGSPHLYFAPGYPALISPLFLLGPRPLLALAVAQWALAVVLLFGVHRWARAVWPRDAAWLTAFVMVNTSLWLYLRRPVSEIAFMAVLVWAAHLLNGALGRRGGAAAWRAAAGAVGLALAGVIRPAGVLFAGGFAAAAAAEAWRGRRRWPAALLLAGFVAALPVVAVGAVIARDRAAQAATASERPTYVRQLLEVRGALGGQLRRGLYLQVLNTGRLLVPGMFKAHSKRREWRDPNLLVYLPVAGLVLLGWVRRVRGAPDVLVWGLPLYVGLHVLWPFDEDTRFLLPVLPVLAGCAWTAAGGWPGARRVLVALVVAHAVAATVFWRKEVPGVRACHAEWAAVDRLVPLLPPEGGAVAAVGVRDCVAAMLTVARDRPVVFVGAGAVPAEVARVVYPAGATPPPGFAPVAERGRYAVAVRAAAAEGGGRNGGGG